ncbi:sensor histidine kinase [Inediibacterium massiliense]|uniref:sensor histidine kinase n=1 Tax=Inediibacterium massiliense TaxID=1658111 RepID=UPI0006B4062F|nr:HAMP domain-containing sensor histidine kinase [Inediibacterium massiliense]
MGLKIIKDKSLKYQFIVNFIKIIFLSFILSIISFIIYFKTFDYIYYPANYYENQLPSIIDKINEKNEEVLNRSFEGEMNKIVPSQGMLYQVLDREGNLIYGNMKKPLVKNKRELYENLNSILRLGNNNFAKVIPIFNKDNDMKGAIILKYQLKSTQKTKNYLMLRLYNLIILIPFVYIIIFTILYAKQLSKKLNKPINMLLDGAEKIKNKNLDFYINYKENNEIGKLCNAFEEMRIHLKDSLIKQWDLEEKRRENIENIAHDLKTPLTIVNTYSEALIDGIVQKDKFKDYIEVIKRNNERALVLLEDMNKISNIENPNFILEPREINMVEFLKIKEKDYRFLCEGKGINFKIDIIDLREKSFVDQFDTKSLEEVLDNMMSNSIRYTEKGDSIKINVLCKDDEIEFCIVDTGRGFSDQDLKNIFNKFYKGDKSRSFKTGHSGLGMYISKTLVEKHGGAITAKNNNPKGAIIEFHIRPIKRKILI